MEKAHPLCVVGRKFLRMKQGPMIEGNSKPILGQSHIKYNETSQILKALILICIIMNTIKYLQKAKVSKPVIFDLILHYDN